MKMRIVACMVFIALIGCTQSPPPVEPETPANKLIGVWKVVGVETDLDIPKTEMGVPDAYMVLTEKYKFVVGSAVPDRPELPKNPTDSQFVAAWSPVWAFIATYKVKGNTVTEHGVFSKNPNSKPGLQGSHPYAFDGDDLLWTVPVGEGENTATFRYTRVE